MYTYMYIYTYMQATIYIRPEDEEAWKNVPNKSQWVHEGLNRGLVTIPAKNTPVATQHIRIDSTPVGENAFHKLATDKVSSSIRPDTVPACCTAKKRCKHWEFNSDTGEWVNYINGEGIEAI